MFTIYGTETQRKQFERSHHVPAFYYGNTISDREVTYYNDNDNIAHMVIDLENGTFALLEVDEYGTCVGEVSYETYEQALEAYNAAIDGEVQ